jgi:hypothetical protein
VGGQAHRETKRVVLSRLLPTVLLCRSSTLPLCRSEGEARGAPSFDFEYFFWGGDGFV